MTRQPSLVSISIPTYNRCELLERAVRSCLDQDHQRLEVVVVDNASTDGTESLMARLVAADPRVRYVRNPTNVGPTANFNLARAEARGDHLMWLGDDDWLEPNYVSACLAVLDADRTLALAAGTVRYEHRGEPRGDGGRIELRQHDPVDRVAGYFARVRDNGTFYGLSPRWAVRRTSGLLDRFGNDWFLLAELAAIGGFGLAPTTAVHREVGGATVSLRNVARSGGHGRLAAEFPQLVLAAEAVRCCWSLPPFRELGPRRFPLGLRCGLVVLRRFLPSAATAYGHLTAERIRTRFRTPVASARTG